MKDFIMKCPIWWTPANENYKGNGRVIISPRAGGPYFIPGTGEAVLNHYADPLKVRLTDWLVEQRKLGNGYPEITANTIQNARQWKDLSASDRADNTLRYLGNKTETLGMPIAYRSTSATSYQLDNLEKTYLELLAHSGSVGDRDLFYLLTYLQKSGLIQHYAQALKQPPSCTVTVEGYTRLAELEKTLVASSKAFVAMWFDPSMNEAWKEGFEPAIRETGYAPIRIDQQEFVDRIDDEVIAEIRRARFIVADFTHDGKGVRGSVYFEAGFALGLNIPVIFTCRKDLLDQLHFDTRQYNHIVWTRPEDLRKALKNRITAKLGDGPDKPSS